MDTLQKFDPGQNVLVAEDVEENRLVLKLLLSQLGLSIDVVDNGRAAIEAIQKRDYHLLLLDCYMPEMDGFSTVQALRASGEERMRRLPIIVMTASRMDYDRKRSLELGADEYIEKPISKQGLVQVLQPWLKLKSFSIDKAVLREVAQMSHENTTVADELFSLFLKNVPKRLRLIERAVRDKKKTVLLRETHALKSSTCQLGALNLKRICDQIEGLIKKESFERVGSLCIELQNEYFDLMHSLPRAIEEMKNY